MVLRFKKSISLGKYLKINCGKKGIGVSAGVKGFRVGVGSRGLYTSVGIPGTGIYCVNYHNTENGNTSTRTDSVNTVDSGGTIFTICATVVLEIYFLFTYSKLALLLPITAALIFFIWKQSPKQQSKKILEKAIPLFNDQKFNEAIPLLKRALELNSTNNFLLLLLGSALKGAKKYNEGIEYLKKFMQHNQQNFDAILTLADCYYHNEQVDDAIKILQTLPKDLANHPKALVFLAACFNKQQNNELAIEVLKSAPLQKRKLDAELKEIHYLLAKIYEESGDKKNAYKHYKKICNYSAGVVEKSY